jgi:hypothetical protein
MRLSCMERAAVTPCSSSRCRKRPAAGAGTNRTRQMPGEGGRPVRFHHRRVPAIGESRNETEPSADCRNIQGNSRAAS